MKYFVLFISLISYLITLSNRAYATDYYISPTGSDTNLGTSDSTPFATFTKGISKLGVGDTLYLMDGTYNQTLNISRSGSPNSEITLTDYQTYPLDHPLRLKNYFTIKALHDGQAIIDGQNQREPVLVNGSYIDLEGIVAKNSSGMVYFIRGKNIVIRRCSGFNADTDSNSHVFTIWSGGSPADPANILVEDSFAGGTGRKMFMAYLSYVNVIFRRLFAAGTDWRGADWCPNNWPWQDGIEIYNYQQPDVPNNSIVENSILYGRVANYGFSLSPNPARTIGNRFLGDIAIKAGMNWNGTPAIWPCNGSSPYNSTCACTKFTEWQSERAGFVIGTYGRPYFKNNLFQDLFAFGNAGAGLSAGQPTQPGGWCDGTEGIGGYPCAKCNKVESSRSDNCSACVYGDTSTPRDQCPLSDYSTSEKSSNNTLNRISLANNGLGSPPPQEGAGTEITSFSFSQFDQFGNKSNLFVEGNSQYADKFKGARLRFRYENGLLTTKELWPWPMEDRIKIELARELPELGASNFSVTNTIVPLLNQYTAEPIPPLLSDYQKFISFLPTFNLSTTIFDFNQLIKLLFK